MKQDTDAAASPSEDNLSAPSLALLVVFILGISLITSVRAPKAAPIKKNVLLNTEHSK